MGADFTNSYMEYNPSLRRLSAVETADRRPVDKRRRLGLHGIYNVHTF